MQNKAEVCSYPPEPMPDMEVLRHPRAALPCFPRSREEESTKQQQQMVPRTVTWRLCLYLIGQNLSTWSLLAVRGWEMEPDWGGPWAQLQLLVL